MSSLADSIPLGWEEAIASSPETLPPGFENSCSQSNPTSPQQENPPSSLSSPAYPLPQENQVNCTDPSHSPSPTPPQESRSDHPPSSLNPPQDSRNHLSHSPRSPPQDAPVSLSISFPPSELEKRDAMPRPPLQPQDGEGPVPSSQLPQGNQGSLNPPLPQSLPEMGQMVCGSCSELLSYPRASKYIQCACCQTTNFVLEAHQLGIVKCGKCSVLLMYPYTSSSLRCSSCHNVTEIGNCIGAIDRADVDARVSNNEITFNGHCESQHRMLWHHATLIFSSLLSWSVEKAVHMTVKYPNLQQQIINTTSHNRSQPQNARPPVSALQGFPAPP